MLKNYLRTSLRHLWRKRLFTALNILGLAIGISSCWIIYRIIQHEFSYDAQLPHKESIYKVVSAFGSGDKMGGISAPLYQGIREEIPGLDHVVPLFYQWINAVEIKRETKTDFIKDDPQQIAATDRAYFEMLPYTWLAGSKASALNTPESVVLTASRAQEYFPGTPPEDILHKTITYFGRDTVQRTVTGIVADYYRPSEFTAQEFLTLPEKTFEKYMWTNTNGSDKLYLQFRAGANVTAILDQINKLDQRHWKAFGEERGSPIKRGKSYELLPLKDIHFATDVSDYGVRKTSKAVLYGLVGIGVFLLILACINYINMSVAQIPQRGREIGVRKTLGSNRWHLIGQFLLETFLTTLFSSILASAFILLGFWIVSDIIPEGLTPYSSPRLFLTFTLSLTLLITLLAGLYPSWLITRVKTTSVFKNFFSGASATRRFSLQKVLIVFQFVIALIFIVSTIIVSTQLRHTLKADMGFNKEAIVLVDVPWKYQNNPRYKDKQFTLLNQLRNLPGIEHIALGSAPLSSGYSSSPFELISDKKDPAGIQVFKKWIDTAYLSMYQMELLAGRNLHHSDTTNEFIINETAAKAFGFKSPQEAVGKMMRQSGNSAFSIVGVVKDFHSQDFYTSIEPLALMSDKQNLLTFNIKLNTRNPSQWQATLKTIKKQWGNIYPPDAFQYHFYDETLESLYIQERQLAKLINLATAITILISCLGLFGLATLTAFQRTKEIGIRKVLGATISGIITMLSKDFIQLICLAFLIASPIAWWCMNKWLEDFIYRVDIEWWMFAVAGLSTVCIALLTVSFQAIKAAIANPVDSLRNE
ncbi:ABC transporter permease [Olivibacter domesticus]|uniref:Duplicated orphan permease n=1 Tax=Olivibacter domesticus TaxID=407022 RepID=A0A1H7SFE7_OLID1|nr:ABC transporter permease [Olivibacter domesticus]SEL71039.1 duplicated orphan permease [Olivibacter domesticus]